ncbi:MAG: pseudaminic acid synthase [Verrucomicrobiota bacterium]
MSTPRARTRLADLWDRPGQHAPLIVAELSGNHNQSLERALKLIEAAAECGVDAIKLQTYTADTITLDAPQDEFHVRKPGSVWDGRSLYSLYQEAYTPWEWHEPMVQRATELGLEWFSSPFDFTAVDFLENLHVPCYKIASPELIDLPLIKRCAATGKPLVMSTGMATVAEIEEAVNAARAGGCTQLVLLKCTTDYPAAPENCHLRTIPHMAQMFHCPTGVSDHTLGIGASIAATAQGAVLIEKHLTLRRADGGPDSHFSLEPEEMKSLVEECHNAWAALGQVWYGPQEAERGFMRGRRSLYIAEDIRQGECLTSQNMRSIRPGFGLPPKHYESLLGRPVTRDVKKGTAVSWDMIAFNLSLTSKQ